MSSKRSGIMGGVCPLIVLVILCLFFVGLGNASQKSSPNEVFVEEKLMLQIFADQTTGYMIYFREKADLSPAFRMDWLKRGRFVMEKLQETAQRSQKNVRSFLDSQKASYEAFWIDNIIVVKSSNMITFNGLMNFTEVESLRARVTPILIEPLDVKSAPQINAVESNLTHIGVDQVWAKGYNGSGIVVGNIDTGVRYTHNALVNQYRGNQGGGVFDHNYSWWDPYSSTTAPDDTHNHGSHTIGTMIGSDGGSNQIGVAPGAKWIAAKGFTPSATDAGLLSCGQFMAAPTDLAGANPNPNLRPHIINNSWGDCSKSYDNWYAGVITSWHAAGIYPVFSNGNAGNCGYSYPPGLNTVGNPGRYGNVTGVGATGRSNGIYATFSNWGPTDNPDTINPRGYANLKPQFVAPGTNRSAGRDSDTAYMDMSGTSMAAPHVSGLIALMWSAAPSLIGNYAATETIIEQTANAIPYDTGGTPPPGPGNVPNYATGWGEINAIAAVKESLFWDNTGVLTGTVTSSVDGKPINNVRVYAESATFDKETSTNNNGEYAMSLHAGIHDVECSAYGFLTKTINNVEIIKDTTTTQNIILEPELLHQVSGMVYDGLTSWPLYARIDIAGYPNNPIWTDPVTGYYSVILPENTLFTLTTGAWVDGYLPAILPIGPLNGDIQVNIPLFFDPVSFNAPGYGTVISFFSEGFEAETFPPSGWNAYNLDGGGTEWARYGSGHTGKASASHRYSTAGVQDGWLVAPAMTIPATGASLSFWEFSDFPTYYVKHSLWILTGSFNDPTANWVEIAEFDNPAQSWRQKKVSLNAYAGQQVYLAFRYQGYDATNWTIDDVSVDTTSIPTGGLVVGNVYDANNAVPINGAFIENEDGYSAESKATPLDPAVPDGFYTIYSPHGIKDFEASKNSYLHDTPSVNVLANNTVRQDFNLSAGLLLVAPSLLHKTVLMGNDAKANLTLENAGTAPLNYNIKEKNGSYTPAYTIVKKIKTSSQPSIIPIENTAQENPLSASELSETGISSGYTVEPDERKDGTIPQDIGAAWEVMAPLPAGRVFNAVVADGNGYVYVIGGSSDAGGSIATDTNYRYDTATNTWSNMAPLPQALQSIDGAVIANKIYIPGASNTATTFVYDIATDSWSSIPANGGYTAREQYQVVAIANNLYVLGGIIGRANSTAEVWILDTQTEIWSAGVPMQKSRTSFSAAAIKGKIYVAGGVLFPGFEPDMTTEVFDGISWSYIAAVPNGGGAYSR